MVIQCKIMENKNKIVELAHNRIRSEKEQRFNKSKPIRVGDIWNPVEGDLVSLKIQGAEKMKEKAQSRMRYNGPYKIEKSRKAPARVQLQDGTVEIHEVVTSVCLPNNTSSQMRRQANIADIKPYVTPEIDNTMYTQWKEILQSTETDDHLSNKTSHLEDELELLRSKIIKRNSASIQKHHCFIDESGTIYDKNNITLLKVAATWKITLDQYWKKCWVHYQDDYKDWDGQI